jgi:hypothetical protein
MMKALTLTFALLLICTGAALATTPDGQTPAEETVCDSETGAAFGLCNAYCEAMDCDSDDPQASDTACTKVRNKFMNVTGNDLPCEAPTTCVLPSPGTTCPCTADSTFNRILGFPGGSCIDQGTSIVFSGNGTLHAGCIPSPACGVGGLPFMSITPEESAACVQLLRDRCAPE